MGENTPFLPEKNKAYKEFVRSNGGNSYANTLRTNGGSSKNDTRHRVKFNLEEKYFLHFEKLLIDFAKNPRMSYNMQ